MLFMRATALRIGIIHPNLGIGGAEKLIVDAAVGLQKLGHTVDIYTSHHDKTRCFEETRDGAYSFGIMCRRIQTEPLQVH